MLAPPDLESLYRMIASPSAPPALKEGEALVGGFEPDVPSRVVELSAERPQEAMGVEPVAPSAQLKGSPELKDSADEGEPQPAGESYLAFLDQVEEQQRARTQRRGDKHGRSRSSNVKGQPKSSPKTKPKAAQPKAAQPSEQSTGGSQAHQPQGGGAQAPQRRRRRRKPSPPKG